jgi:hypothetical protein
MPGAIAGDTLPFYLQLNEVLDLFVERTTERTRAVGSATQMKMDEMDEYTTPDAQKVRPVTGNLGFPLRKFGISLQWTRTFLENATPWDLAMATLAALDADRRNIYAEIKRVLFYPLAYTFKDRFVDWYPLPVTPPGRSPTGPGWGSTPTSI